MVGLFVLPFFHIRKQRKCRDEALGRGRRRAAAPSLSREDAGRLSGKEANFSLRVKFFSTSAEQQYSLNFSIFTPPGRPLVAQHGAASGVQQTIQPVKMGQCLSHVTGGPVIFQYKAELKS